MNPMVGDIVTVMMHAIPNGRVPYVCTIRRDIDDARAYGMDYHGPWVVPDFVDDLIEGIDWCRGGGRAEIEALLVAQALT